ncbi:MAG: hypothetical protein HC902_07445 [Calothrix sp. SM1_5_4]|nr:hypothetical protein [Calothrix sp. SM1_5_4]
MPAPWYPQMPAALPGADAPTVYQAPDTEARTPAARLFKRIFKNKVRAALYILAPLLIVLAALPKKKSETAPRDPASGGASVNFEKLTKEQKSVVKDSFNLARNLYVQGKYALCLTELAKLHEIIPQFENSKELQSFCDQGLELVKRQERRRPQGA